MATFKRQSIHRVLKQRSQKFREFFVRFICTFASQLLLSFYFYLKGSNFESGFKTVKYCYRRSQKTEFNYYCIIIIHFFYRLPLMKRTKRREFYVYAIFTGIKYKIRKKILIEMKTLTSNIYTAYQNKTSKV